LSEIRRSAINTERDEISGQFREYPERNIEDNIPQKVYPEQNIVFNIREKVYPQREKVYPK
jgi:hypothetical protein